MLNNLTMDLLAALLDTRRVSQCRYGNKLPLVANTDLVNTSQQFLTQNMHRGALIVSSGDRSLSNTLLGILHEQQPVTPTLLGSNAIVAGLDTFQGVSASLFNHVGETGFNWANPLSGPPIPTYYDPAFVNNDLFIPNGTFGVIFEPSASYAVGSTRTYATIDFNIPNNSDYQISMQIGATPALLVETSISNNLMNVIYKRGAFTLLNTNVSIPSGDHNLTIRSDSATGHELVYDGTTLFASAGLSINYTHPIWLLNASVIGEQFSVSRLEFGSPGGGPGSQPYLARSLQPIQYPNVLHQTLVDYKIPPNNPISVITGISDLTPGQHTVITITEGIVQ